MAKHRSNGHASNRHVNGAVAEPLRAPAGGVRAGGKFYRGGSIMPKRYARERDPATGMPLAAPNFGRMVLPHAITFVGKQSTVAHVYRNPDEAVLRSGGQSWKMRRDPSIMECLEARQRATALLGWHLEVEDEKDPQQKRLKDEMTKIVKRTYQFTEYRRNLLEAIWYGRYAVQHKFGFANIDGQRRTIIEGWRPINGDKLVFRFDDGSGKYRDDEVGVRVTPVYSQKDALAGDRKLEVTDLGMAYFLQPWERSLVAIHRHIIEDGDYEDPISAGRIHGVGVRDRIYWCWYQKQETMAQLMEVIDRTGSGITIYWYPAGNAQAEADTIALAEKQKHENVLVMPRQGGDPTLDAYGIDRIEPNAGGIEMMSKIVDEFFGDQIMRYICGGTLFSKSKSLGIGGGGADIQEQSFFLIVQYDSIKLEETISHEMVAPLKQFNCPWARDIPLWFKIDTDSPDSLEKLQAAKTLWEMGQKIKGSELMGKVGLSVPADGEEFLQNPAAAPQMGMPGMPGQPGMPGDPTAEGGQQGDMQDLFGPLASEFGGDEGGADDGGEPPQSPPMGGGPAQYAKRGLAAAIEATDTKPTDAQREAGNYAKGKFAWNGLTISIENPAGTKRRPEWKPLAHHYGYINRTEGKDGDHVDVFLGPDLDSDLVVVIDQPTDGGRFDEHKCLIGFTNAEDAAAGYLANYDEGWKLGPVTTMTVEQFKNWLADGDTTKPIEEQVSRYAKRQIRSSPGQQPLSILGDVNTKKHHLWREELHPRDSSGQWTEKAGGKSLPKQFGQGMLFSEMAAKLHQSEQQASTKAGKAEQKSLFDMLAMSDIHPEQVAALLSGDDQRLRELEKEAIATGQHEHSPQGAEEPSPPIPEPSNMPTEGMPGGEARQDDGDGFSLERQKQKVGRGIGTEDKTPETGGRQESFWHGMGDAEGQGKLFGGLDLAGGQGPAAEKPSRPSTYINGDRAEYTGQMINGMHELEMMEGLHAGTHRVTARGPDGSDPYSDRNKQAWKDQQEQFSRLHDKSSGEQQKPAPQTGTDSEDRQTSAAEEDAKSQPAEEPEPAQSAPMSLATLASHSDQIRKGEASADQIRQWFGEYHASQDAIRQELNGKTVAELKKMGAGGWHANGMKKGDLVKDALQRIGQQYHVKESFRWSPMTESHADALKRAIDKQTDDDVKAHAARHAARDAEYQGRVESFKKSLDNPETLEEFQQHIKANGGIDKLSDEQLAKYDDLVGSNRRTKAAAERSTVKGFSGGEQKAGATGIVEGHHQKRNAPTYTVTVENRLGDDGFKEALSRAKALGGSYVNAMIAKRYGATPGFQFFDRASAEQFSKVLKGESVDRSEAEGERKAEQIENASERLKALAATTHAAADEQLNAERKTNTHKRAEQAASAEANARGQKALAETMERLSDAMGEGKAKHLEGIRNRQHVVELNRQLRSARNSRMTAEGSHKLPYDQYREMSERPAEAEDIRHVEYPHPKFWQSQLLSHASEFENEPGLKLIAARLKKAAAASVKFKGRGGGYKFSGGQVLTPNQFEHSQLAAAVKVNGLKEGQGVRIHQSHDWRLAEKSGGRGGPFYTADGGKSFGTSPEIAVSAALNRGHALDFVDTPKDELITLNDPREIADLTDAVSRLRRSSNRSLRRTAEELHSRLDSYNRLQAMDIKNRPELRAALREYLPLRTKPKGEDKIKKLERSLVGSKIEGFFPTPRPLVERMIDAAGIEPGHSVLEPSAGKGDILDAVRDRHPDANTEAIEPHSSLRELVQAKGHNLVGRDFLEHSGQYDRVLMNPPFEKGQDAEHVQHAFKNLKDGGRIVAIMSAGPFQRSDKKSQAFRDWFDSVGGTVEDLPEGSFAGSDAFRQTGVNTKLVVIDK